jgi:aryl-alcohol dehydrogenase-like predicted oxidoreductase
LHGKDEVTTSKVMGKRSTASAAGGRAAKTTAARASAAGTSRRAARFATAFGDDFFRRARTELTVSSLALGTYLGDSDDETDGAYAESVRIALARGINIFDTAINYRCQRSERAIGRALGAAFAAGDAQRDEIVVCTKAGYIPLDGGAPQSREEYQRYLEREYLAPGILSAGEIVGGAHALAPKFLEDQLHRSLANLRVDAVDYFYLHNPEQQLAAIAPDELYARIRDAFKALEGCVDAGKIGAYGVATWHGLRLPAESQGHLSLFRLEALAREVAGERHHFRMVQLPINLSMSEAVRVSTQRDRRGRLHSVVEAAEQLGVDVVASAPLLQGRLTAGLPEAVRQMFPGSTDSQRALAFARSIPGVLSVAVGTRQAGHLEENLSAFARAGG